MPRSTASGEFEGFIGSVIDISERRAAEDAVRESEERFRFMADAAPVMIWLDDENAHCTYFSKPWLDFTGRPLGTSSASAGRTAFTPRTSRGS